MEELLDDDSNRSGSPAENRSGSPAGEDTDDFDETDLTDSRRGSPRPPGVPGRLQSSRLSIESNSLPVMYSSSPRESHTGSPVGNNSATALGHNAGGSNLSRLSNQMSLLAPHGRSSADSLPGGNTTTTTGSTKRESEYNVIEPDTSYEKVPRLDELTVQEILGLLKVKTSMLALGACERVKRIAKAHPLDVIASPILAELVNILKDGPGTNLAGAAMSALATMALVPEGRQKICILGCATPLIKLIARAEVSKPNTDKAVGLLMNLAADQQNRRIVRQSGGIEALVAVLNAASLDSVMEHAMGALHNTMLADAKSKARAVDAGVLVPLIKVVSSKLDENSCLLMRAKLLMGELVKVPGMEEKLHDAAAAYA